MEGFSSSVKQNGSAKADRARRPDKAIYVPRAQRHSKKPSRSVPTAAPATDTASQFSAKSEPETVDHSDAPLGRETPPSPDDDNPQWESQYPRTLTPPPETANYMERDEEEEEAPPQPASTSEFARVPSQSPPLGGTSGYQAAAGVYSGSSADDDDEDGWDAIYDENGVCLKPDIVAEITSSVGEITLEQPVYDYLQWKPKEQTLTSGEFAHVIELYEFPAEFKTEHLLLAYARSGLQIKWVDDTHALGVFQSAAAAGEALMIDHPVIKSRPASEASAQSKRKLRACVELQLCAKPRPETTAHVARNLITGALGIRAPVSREQRAAERKKIDDEREKRRKEKHQKESIWEGDV